MSGYRNIAVVVAFVMLLPAIAFAQAGIAGTVRDTSGAVLPGVTVEAASPALIEKVRVGVTDGAGQYRIENLRPGTYAVTFTLTGFNTFRRDGVELTGSFIATVNAEMRVGAVEESITVSGNAPTVDVQSTNRQQVLSSQVVDALPTGRMYFTLGVLTPGVTSNNPDVGGTTGDTMSRLVIHGGRGDDQRVLTNGLNYFSPQAPSIGGNVPNMSGAQEVTIDTSGANAETQTGGVTVNFIQRDGGNTFAGTAFFTYANEHMASNNFTQRLRDAGLRAVNTLKSSMDINPGLGGPLVRDRLWFYASGRYQTSRLYAPGMFFNKNEFDPTKWTFEPDTGRRALSNNAVWKDYQLRLTWQATPKNKIAGSWDEQMFCRCPHFISATRSPDAGVDRRFPIERLQHVEWMSTVTNKVLIEAVGMYGTERWGNMHLRPEAGGGSLDVTPAQLAAYPQMIGVVEQQGTIAGLNYRAPVGTFPGTFNNNRTGSLRYRASLSYVPGSHSLKVGWGDINGFVEEERYMVGPPISYRFNSPVVNGVVIPTPNQLTQWATPFSNRTHQDHDLGAFVQDKWTLNRLTLNLGLRYDWFAVSFPEQHVGPATLLPNRNFTFPEQESLNWKDLSPRIGGVYDLRGDGKTALKGSLNRYVAGGGLNGIGSNSNPVLAIVTNTTRAWTDADGDFVADCDLLVTGANGECGPMANSAWGTSRVSLANDSALRKGWNVRSFNWEFSAGVQHEIAPRVSADVSFFRRWYGNFTVTDDVAREAADYDSFSITAPVNSRLPGGGGNTIAGLVDLKPQFFGQPVQNQQMLVKNLPGSPSQSESWSGVDVNLNLRFSSDFMFQGGLSTGRRVADSCEVVALVPEAIGQTPASFCRIEEPFLTQVKALGIYTIPGIDVQIAGTLQSAPGAPRLATFNVSSAQAQLSLGRPLSTGANSNQTVNIIAPGTETLERLNQLDLRFGKILRLAENRRMNLSLDVYNVFNADTVLSVNQNYTSLWVPTNILQSRLFKISAQVDF